MTTNNRNARRLSLIGLAVAVLGAAGCQSERDGGDGDRINSIILPTDVVLNLYCADVGIFPENCVLDDPENPFATTTIIEFDVNNPGRTTSSNCSIRFRQARGGAKARFYFWATALARRPSGENQFYTALALHELYDANSNVLSTDVIARDQALRAYQAVLDNFFGSVTVFECCPAASPTGDPVAFPVPLNELTADNLYRTDATGLLRLVPGDPILVLNLLLDWGYTYQPATPPIIQ